MSPVGVALGLAGVGTAAYVAPQALRIPAVRVLRGAVRERRALCLTYDDGPGPETTPLLLDRLAAAGGRATFFAIAMGIEDHPELIDRMVAQGHQVGAHSARHLHGWKVDPLRHARDNDAGFRSLDRWSDGERPLFRPTYGKLTAASWAVALRHRAHVAWWTLDSGDTWAQLPRASTVVDAVSAADGGVVLMHDLDRSAPRRDYVLEVTDRLLELAARQDLSVLTIGELMAGSWTR